MSRLPETELEFSDEDLVEWVRGNLAECRRVVHDGPPGRFVPEGLCGEIDEVLGRIESLMQRIER